MINSLSNLACDYTDKSTLVSTSIFRGGDKGKTLFKNKKTTENKLLDFRSSMSEVKGENQIFFIKYLHLLFFGVLTKF